MKITTRYNATVVLYNDGYYYISTLELNGNKDNYIGEIELYSHSQIVKPLDPIIAFRHSTNLDIIYILKDIGHMCFKLETHNDNGYYIWKDAMYKYRIIGSFIAKSIARLDKSNDLYTIVHGASASSVYNLCNIKIGIQEKEIALSNYIIKD